jgi:parvulin-like peptidyl-prolyl isomerase
MSEELRYELDDEPRDNAKWWWLAVIAVFVVSVGLVWGSGAINPDTTRAHVRHILITFDRANPEEQQHALDLANDIKKRLAAGEEFGDLASEFSDDPISKSTGGDLGFSKVGDYVDAFEKYVWAADLHKVSDPILTTFGYHLIEVLDRKYSKIDQYKEEEKARIAEQASKELNDAANALTTTPPADSGKAPAETGPAN